MEKITDKTFDGEHPNDEHIIGLVYDPVKRIVEVPVGYCIITHEELDMIEKKFSEMKRLSGEEAGQFIELVKNGLENLGYTVTDD